MERENRIVFALLIFSAIWRPGTGRKLKETLP